MACFCFFPVRGNFEEQSPYSDGTSCASCTSSQCCDNGLCAGGNFFYHLALEVAISVPYNIGSWGNSNLVF